MKRMVFVALLLCGLAGTLRAQTVDTTVCAVLKNPTAFNGKMVSIKGTVVSGFDQFVVNDGNCGLPVNGIWITYPAGTKAKGGPLAMVRLEPAHNFAGTIAPGKQTPVVLNRDKQFKRFDSLLSQMHDQGPGTCLGCREYDVQATLVGRLDAVARATLDRKGGKIVGLGGFGDMNAYPAQLVLESVSDVTGKKVDYAKLGKKPQKGSSGSKLMAQQNPYINNPLPPTVTSNNPYIFDPVATLQKKAAALRPSQLTTAIQKDAAVFPTAKEKIKDGVSINYGAMDEVPASAGTADSSDGALFECTFNKKQLGSSLGMALIFLGQQINDLRNPQPGNENAPPYIQENNAWVVATAFGAANQVNFLVMPGGYVMWDSAWPPADQETNMQNALNGFLTNELMLSK